MMIDKILGELEGLLGADSCHVPIANLLYELIDGADYRYVQVLPCPGWRTARYTADGGVIGVEIDDVDFWALTLSGSLVPIFVFADGDMGNLTEESKFICLLSPRDSRSEDDLMPEALAAAKRNETKGGATP